MSIRSLPSGLNSQPALIDQCRARDFVLPQVATTLSHNPPNRHVVRCEECLRIARALRAAWRTDSRTVRTKLDEVAASSRPRSTTGRCRVVASIAAMPDSEMTTLLDAHYPEVAEAKRRWDEHEQVTGHHVPLHAGWVLSAYGLGEELEELPRPSISYRPAAYRASD